MNIKSWIDHAITWSPVTKKWGRLWGISAYIGLLAMFIIILVSAVLPKTKPVSHENFATVHKGSFVLDIIESGEIQAFSERIVTAPMMWSATLQIVELIEEGTLVSEGDTLIQFDTADLQTSLDLARDRVTTLEADLEKLESQQKLTIYNQEKALQLSQFSYDQAKLRLQMRQFESDAKKEEARLQLKQAEIDLIKQQKQLKSQRIIHNSQLLERKLAIKQARNRLNDYIKRMDLFTLTAPTAGMVVYKDVGNWNSRERLKKGYNARPREELLSIPDLSRMQIRLFINEVDRLRIVPGIETEISLDAYPDAAFKGRIREIATLAQRISFDSELKGFLAFVDIEGADPRLKPGITAKVKIELETEENTLFVPVGAVFERNGIPVVCPLKGSRPLKVELGPRNDGFVVLKNGVKSGMKLSWVPFENVHQLGRMEEQSRINEVNKTLKRSFAVFEERGILYDYFNEIDSSEEKESATGSSVDISTLPPLIRNRLETGSADKDEAGAPVEVGDPGDKTQKKVFKVSPEMMERLKNK